MLGQLNAYRLYDHVCFLAGLNRTHFVEHDDVVRHFAPSYSREPGDEAKIDQLINSMVVSGFLMVCGTYITLTRKRLPEFQGTRHGYEQHDAQLASRPAPPVLQARSEAGVKRANLDEGTGILFTTGPAASSWDPNADGADDQAAYFDTDDLPKLHRALRKAAQEAGCGRDYQRTLTGSDIGDVVVRARDAKVELSVVPYAWQDRKDWDAEQELPADEVPDTYLNDDDEEVEYTPAERQAMIADVLREREAQWAAELAARPDLTTRVDPGQVDQLIAALKPFAEDAPAGVLPPGTQEATS